MKCWAWIASLSMLLGSAAADAADPSCFLVDIDAAGWTVVEEFKTLPGTEWWIESGSDMVVCGTDLAAPLANRRARSVALPPLEPSELRLALKARNDEFSEEQIVARAGRHLLVRVNDQEKADHDFGTRLVPVAANTVLAQLASNAKPRKARAVNPGLAAIADEVNVNAWFSDVVNLASFSRSTHGTQIIGARDSLVATLSALPGITVTTPSFQVSGTTAWNVIGTLTGSSTPENLVIVGGHYDSSCSSDFFTCDADSAPGAEDNASGCAGVLELARVFAAHPPDSTMLFICYSGEEQGLYGSYDHVADLQAAGLDDNVVVAIIMDMIAYEGDGAYDVLIETEPFSQDILPVFTDSATMTALDAPRTLVATTSTSAWGSDHEPYLDNSIPSALTIENDWNIYPDYHRTTDVPANLDLTMAELILRMNAVAAAHYAGVSPSPPGIFADDFEDGTTNHWVLGP